MTKTAKPRQGAGGHCNVEGCPNKRVNNGVCRRHGATVTLCRAEGCPNQAQRGGVCIRHGAQPKQCRHAGCRQHAKNGGVCKKHGARVQICKEATCTNQVQDFAAGVCATHGAAFKACAVEGCRSKAKKFGLCWKHGGKDTCGAEGCGNAAQLRGMCKRHDRERRAAVGGDGASSPPRRKRRNAAPAPCGEAAPTDGTEGSDGAALDERALHREARKARNDGIDNNGGGAAQSYIDDSGTNESNARTIARLEAEKAEAVFEARRLRDAVATLQERVSSLTAEVDGAREEIARLRSRIDGGGG